MVSAFGTFNAAPVPVAPLPATAISSLTLELKVGGHKWVMGRDAWHWVVHRGAAWWGWRASRQGVQH